jgi:iron(III) transport system ATP-binding protein
MSSVVVKGLVKAFGPTTVLSGVDLEVPEGSLTAVLGPSGSGKTTLLRVLAGFERASAGSVAISGTIVEDARTHVPPEARGVGYVPQEGALFPHLDAAGNVGFGLPRRERRGKSVAELLELVGLAGKGHLYPHQLSGGQQQRVAVARALAVRPRLVLLDEPFSSLDPALRAEVRADVVRVLRETATTAVLVTHDQDEALSVADGVAVLWEGRVAQVASPQDLYYRPLGPSLARFVGEANILTGELEDGSVRTALGHLLVADDLADNLAGGLAPGLVADPAGQQVLVLVRPEQLRVEEARADQAAVTGTVTKSEFYGHDMLVTIEVQDGAGFRRLQARLSGRPPIPAGTLVALSVREPVMAWPYQSDTRQLRQPMPAGTAEAG